MLLVSRVENADMFALYFLSKPSPIYDKDNPDGAPSQKLGYDCSKVRESSQERYNRAHEKELKNDEGARAPLFYWNCQKQPLKRLWTPVLLWRN